MRLALSTITSVVATATTATGFHDGAKANDNAKPDSDRGHRVHEEKEDREDGIDDEDLATKVSNMTLYVFDPWSQKNHETSDPSFASVETIADSSSFISDNRKLVNQQNSTTSNAPKVKTASNEKEDHNIFNHDMGVMNSSHFVEVAAKEGKVRKKSLKKTGFFYYYSKNSIFYYKKSKKKSSKKKNIFYYMGPVAPKSVKKLKSGKKKSAKTGKNTFVPVTSSPTASRFSPFRVRSSLDVQSGTPTNTIINTMTNVATVVIEGAAGRRLLDDGYSDLYNEVHHRALQGQELNFVNTVLDPKSCTCYRIEDSPIPCSCYLFSLEGEASQPQEAERSLISSITDKTFQTLIQVNGLPEAITQVRPFIIVPTSSPSSSPTGGPPSSNSNPSLNPSKQLSLNPSSVPTSSPSEKPSSNPSSVPSSSPSSFPSEKPSPNPSSVPSSSPSSFPSEKPSLKLTSVPSFSPSLLSPKVPTFSPSESSFPSEMPSFVPSLLSPKVPTFSPSESSFPSEMPSFVPSLNPKVSSGLGLVAELVDCMNMASCEGSAFKYATTMNCYGKDSCRNANIQESQIVYCSGEQSCLNADIKDAVSAVTCVGDNACQGSVAGSGFSIKAKSGQPLTVRCNSGAKPSALYRVSCGVDSAGSLGPASQYTYIDVGNDGGRLICYGTSCGRIKVPTCDRVFCQNGPQGETGFIDGIVDALNIPCRCQSVP